MTFAEDVARDLAEVKLHLADAFTAVVLSIDDVQKLVKVRVALDGVMVVPWIGSRPWEGETVRVGVFANQPFCLGSVYGHALGAVVSVASSKVTVLGDDAVTYADYTYPYGLALAAGNRVAMDHKSRQVLHRLSTDPAPLTPPDMPVAQPVTVTKTFNPTDSANFRNGSYSSSYVEISDTRSGHYYYGTQIADTIPDSATINSATLSLSELWDNVPGTASKLGMHGDTGVGGEPGLSGSIDVFDGGDVDIKSFADSLKTGAKFGVGFAKGYGWRRFDSAAGSGAITIRYTYVP